MLPMEVGGVKGGNRGNLPQVPSVRGTLNSAEFVQIRSSESGTSFTVYSFSKGFVSLLQHFLISI